MKVSFYVSGVPKAQPRPRVARGHAYNPDNGVKRWKELIQHRWAHCSAAMKMVGKLQSGDLPLRGPVRIYLVFEFEIPKSRRGKLYNGEPHTSKPDGDNLAKAVCDCLTQAGVWVDDRQLYLICVSKRWKEGVSGVNIVIHSDEEVKK